MLANELGRRGVSCLIVDTKPGTAFNPQANATQARTMEHYRRLGFAQEVRAKGLPADHPTDIAYLTRFAGIELARLRLPTAAAAPNAIKQMSGSWSAAELPHRVSQKFVEVVLRQQAQRWPSIDLRYGWQLQSFSDTGNCIEARVAPVQAGHEQSLAVRARYLVGADGARSMVRSQLGISWEGATGFKRNFMGGRMLAVYLRAPDFYAYNPNERAWMYVVVNPQLRAFIMSVDGQGEMAFHIQMKDDEATEALTEADARYWFHQAYGSSYRLAHGRDMDLEILSMATWTAGHALVAQRFHHGRVFLGGDAAHLFTPTGGLGYNTAVEDAVNLGWKLAHVLRSQAPPTLLASYAYERKMLATRNTGHARRLADSVGLFEAVPELEDPTPQGEAARSVASDYLNGHVRREFNIPGITFGGRYDGSPIVVSDGTNPPADEPNQYTPSACPGGRPPHAWLADGSSLFDHFNKEWTLLVTDSEAAIDIGSSFEAEAQQLNLDLLVVRPNLEPLLALYEAPLALIRPDQIVAWRGHSAADAGGVLRQALGFDASPFINPDSIEHVVFNRVKQFIGGPDKGHP
jgi:2-polyprenyl-6-methoxyphenol hydroxylase-like FAD-dependent oxidoreductase